MNRTLHSNWIILHVNIMVYVYMSFGLQILVCHLSHCQHLMTAQDDRHINIINTVLFILITVEL